MTEGLESRIERFRQGRKIHREAFQDYLRHINIEETVYSSRIHDTRVDGLTRTDKNYPRKQFWELIGYLTGVIESAIRHPKLTYDIYAKKVY